MVRLRFLCCVASGFLTQDGVRVGAHHRICSLQNAKAVNLDSRVICYRAENVNSFLTYFTCLTSVQMTLEPAFLELSMMILYIARRVLKKVTMI